MATNLSSTIIVDYLTHSPEKYSRFSAFDFIHLSINGPPHGMLLAWAITNGSAKIKKQHSYNSDVTYNGTVYHKKRYLTTEPLELHPDICLGPLPTVFRTHPHFPSPPISTRYGRPSTFALCEEATVGLSEVPQPSSQRSYYSSNP